MELSYHPAITFLGTYLKEVSQHTIEVPMFTAALVTRVKLWNQPRYLTTHDMDKGNVIHIHNGVLFSHIYEELNCIICRKMDGSGHYHVT
jgi:hypothetical protein